jgi:hypothetical protein
VTERHLRLVWCAPEAEDDGVDERGDEEVEQWPPSSA